MLCVCTHACVCASAKTLLSLVTIPISAPKIQLCKASIGRSSHARDLQIHANEGLPASVPHMFKSVLSDHQHRAALISGSAILCACVAFLPCPKLGGLKCWLRLGCRCLFTSLINHQVLTNISHMQLVVSNGYLRIYGGWRCSLPGRYKVLGVTPSSL